MEKKGRRLVISDIHGCAKTLAALLDKIKLTEKDSLYFLGDYIDRGPDSGKVSDIIIDLKNKFPSSVFPITGNHEYQLLQAEKEYDEETFYFYVKTVNKSGSILDETGKIKKKYRDFFKSLPLFIELNDCFLVHAGFDFKKDNPFSDVDSMLNIRNFKYDKKKAKGKKIIIGHDPAEYPEIKRRIDENNDIIKLDNGCIYTKSHKIHDYTKLGKLCCFNIDTKELICQKNIE